MSFVLLRVLRLVVVLALLGLLSVLIERLRVSARAREERLDPSFFVVRHHPAIRVLSSVLVVLMVLMALPALLGTVPDDAAYPVVVTQLSVLSLFLVLLAFRWRVRVTSVDVEFTPVWGRSRTTLWLAVTSACVRPLNDRGVMGLFLRDANGTLVAKVPSSTVGYGRLVDFVAIRPWIVDEEAARP